MWCLCVNPARFIRMTMASSRDFFSVGLTFAVWTVTSFLCHKLAKLAITSFIYDITNNPLLAAVLVTVWQLSLCYATISISSRQGRLFSVIAISHAVASLATNTSLALVFASSTMAVKLLEPMTSSLLQSLVLNAPMRVESLVSMVMVVTGAIMFIGDPLSSSFMMKGILMAFLSNVVLGVRNVAIKLDQSNNSEMTLRPCVSVSLYGIGVSLFLAVTVVLEFVLLTFPSGSTNFLLLCIASSVCHVTYSYVSTNLMLRYMSVVGHSLANILKRVLVVLLLHASGGRLASVWNWAGFVVCACGLVLYNFRKLKGASSESMTHSLSVTSSPTSSAWCKSGSSNGKTSEILQDHSRKTALLYRILCACVLLYGLYFVPSDLGVIGDVTYANKLRHGLVKWRDGEKLIKVAIVFQPQEENKANTEEFVKQKAISVPQNTDQRSPYLSTTQEVVAEALRVQLDLLHSLLEGRKYVILIGAASFENKGDPAITVGQIRLLDRLGVKLVFYINEEKCDEAHYERAVAAAQKLKLTKDDLTILMQGGGNIVGYSPVNFCRNRSLSYFPGYKTILLSQSVFMAGSKELLDSMVDIYCCKPHLTIFLRDRLSLYIAQRLFGNGTQLVLAPDMAFGIGSVERFSPPFYDILWINRNDGERPGYTKLPPLPANVTVHVQDWFRAGWDTPRGSTTIETAHNVMMNGLLFLQRGRVVITERLHGHILSTLLDIPHVILDNPDNKLSSYHNTWTRGLANVRLTSDPAEAVRMAVELLQQYSQELPRVFTGMGIREHDDVSALKRKHSVLGSALVDTSARKRRRSVLGSEHDENSAR